MKLVYEDVFLYIAVALFIGLTMAFANYALGFSKEQRVRRRNAKLEFRGVLETDLKTILQSNDDARHVLGEKEAKYQEAKELLRKHLLFWQRRGFDKAWEVFFYHTENKNIPYLEQYMDFGSLDKRKACRSILGSRIGVLLNYAKVQP